LETGGKNGIGAELDKKLGFFFTGRHVSGTGGGRVAHAYPRYAPQKKYKLWFLWEGCSFVLHFHSHPTSMPSLIVVWSSVELDFGVPFIGCQDGGFPPRLTTPCHFAVSNQLPDIW